jgi:parvulin-like peptidyl-prolyl isomerase
LKRFVADWRNVALTVAAVIIVFFIVSAFTTDHSTNVGKVVRVGDRVITDSEVVNELKRQQGDDLVMRLISLNLIESYAAQKNVSASREEIEQVLNFNRFQAMLQNKDFDKSMAEAGVSPDEMRRQVTSLVLMVKLVVPKEKIAATVAKLLKQKPVPLAYPARYTVRQYAYTTEADAKAALALFNKGGKDMEEAANKSINKPKPEDTVTVIPALTEKFEPKLKALLATLKDGQFSEVYKAPSKIFLIIEMVKSQPEELPTAENRGIMIGQQLMKEDEELALKAKNLEADALRSVDVQFYTQAYKQAYEKFTKFQDQNKVINPGGASSTPGSSAPPSLPPLPNTGK